LTIVIMAARRWRRQERRHFHHRGLRRAHTGPVHRSPLERSWWPGSPGSPPKRPLAVQPRPTCVVPTAEGGVAAGSVQRRPGHGPSTRTPPTYVLATHFRCPRLWIP